MISMQSRSWFSRSSCSWVSVSTDSPPKPCFKKPSLNSVSSYLILKSFLSVSLLMGIVGGSTTTASLPKSSNSSTYSCYPSLINISLESRTFQVPFYPSPINLPPSSNLILPLILEPSYIKSNYLPVTNFLNFLNLAFSYSSLLSYRSSWIFSWESLFYSSWSSLAVNRSWWDY
jgi:hypothetical protein